MKYTRYSTTARAFQFAQRHLRAVDVVADMNCCVSLVRSILDLFIR